MITDFVISTIQYMEKNLQVEAIGAIIAVTLMLLVLLSLILLVFRGIRLWYWRVNEQVITLEKIDKCLEEIKQTLPERGNDLEIKESTETNQAELKTETPKVVFDKKDDDNGGNVSVKEKYNEYNVGKTGNIYAEDLLRKQIQF